MTPYAIDAERAVIGAMLVRPEATPEAATLLSPDDFGMPLHAAIFAACVALWKVGARPDAVTVADRLRAGGVVFEAPDLVSLQAQATSLHPHDYAVIVVEYATRRRALGIAAEMTARLSDPTLDLEDVLDAARTDLDVVRMPNTVSVADLTDADTFAATAESPLSWVIPGLLDVEDRVIVVAPEGVGKSMVSRWMATAASQGFHPFARIGIDPVSTLIVDLENPARVVRRTLRPMLASLRRWTGGLGGGMAYDPYRCHVWHRPGGLNLRTRSAVAELDAVCSAVKPRLVCLGPLYKSYRGDPRRSEHDNAGDVAAVLDDLRTRHGFALVLEHHAPLAQGGSRELRPFGSLLWSQWPEVGLTLSPTDGTRRHLKVGFYRGSRDERCWPATLSRDDVYPWRATYPPDARPWEAA